MVNDSLVYHLSTNQEIDHGKNIGYIVNESLEVEGFIHCCYVHQLAGVLERYFSGRKDLMLLTINSALLKVEMRLENTVGGQELFPHIYGPVNMEAVVSIEVFGRDKIDTLKQTGCW